MSKSLEKRAAELERLTQAQSIAIESLLKYHNAFMGIFHDFSSSET